MRKPLKLNKKSKAELEKVRQLYQPLDRISETYSKAIQRQVSKMKRTMMGAFRQRIVPIIREYEKEKSKKLATNSSEELERLLEKYTTLVALEIAATMAKIQEFFDERAMSQIVERFSRAMCEAQRRILLAEIFEESGEVNRSIYQHLRNGASDIEEIREEFMEDNLAFLPLTIPVEYMERVQKEIVEGMEKGRSISDMTAQINEYGAMGDRRAAFLANDQVGAFSLALAAFNASLLGFGSFQWVTMNDDLVRPEHAALDGMVFTWFYGTGLKGKNGQPLYPGSDFGCRCIARAVI